MSIYYFMKQRFPRREKRAELRGIFDEHGNIPESIIHDDKYFENFRLKLAESLPNHRNKFQGLSYATLEGQQDPIRVTNNQKRYNKTEFASGR